MYFEIELEGDKRCVYLAFMVVVRLLRSVWLFATPWTAARLASLSFTVLEFDQTHVYRVGDAIQPTHPLSPPSPLVLNLSQHQGLMSQLFASGGQSIEALASASVLSMNIQVDFL